MAADEDRAALADIERLAPRATIVYLGSEQDLATVASRLYASMRELDAPGVDRILARGFPGDDGLAVAIRRSPPPSVCEVWTTVDYGSLGSDPHTRIRLERV